MTFHSKNDMFILSKEEMAYLQHLNENQILQSFEKKYKEISINNVINEWEKWTEFDSSKLSFSMPDLNKTSLSRYTQAFFDNIDKLLKQNNDFRFIPFAFKEYLFILFDMAPDEIKNADFKYLYITYSISLMLIHFLSIFSNTYNIQIHIIKDTYNKAKAFIKAYVNCLIKIQISKKKEEEEKTNNISKSNTPQTTPHQTTSSKIMKTKSQKSTENRSQTFGNVIPNADNNELPPANKIKQNEKAVQSNTIKAKTHSVESQILNTENSKVQRNKTLSPKSTKTDNPNNHCISQTSSGSRSREENVKILESPRSSSQNVQILESKTGSSRTVNGAKSALLYKKTQKYENKEDIIKAEKIILKSIKEFKSRPDNVKIIRKIKSYVCTKHEDLKNDICPKLEIVSKEVMERKPDCNKIQQIFDEINSRI